MSRWTIPTHMKTFIAALFVPLYKYVLGEMRPFITYRKLQAPRIRSYWSHPFNIPFRMEHWESDHELHSKITFLTYWKINSTKLIWVRIESQDSLRLNAVQADCAKDVFICHGGFSWTPNSALCNSNNARYPNSNPMSKMPDRCLNPDSNHFFQT